MISRCVHHNVSLTRCVTAQRWASRKATARPKPAGPKRKRHIEPDASEYPDNPEDQLKYLRQAELMSSKNGFDIWAAPVDTLDVDVPYRTAPWSKSKFSGITERFSQLLENFYNKGKSLSSMMRIVSTNSLPGINTANLGIFSIFRGGRLTSTNEKAWVAPMRKLLMQNYISAQQALAARDKEALARYTQPPYHQEADRLMKKEKANTYFWTFHREVSPSKIISIRCIDGHLGSSPPSFGNRLLINALVKFETEQSLEVYDAHGNALHSPEPGATRKGRRIPAEKRQLTEYYIFEKRMYMNTPWQIKERVYPKPGREPAV